MAARTAARQPAPRQPSRGPGELGAAGRPGRAAPSPPGCGREEAGQRLPRRSGWAMAEGGKAQEGQEKENNKEPCDERRGAAAALPPARWRGAAARSRRGGWRRRPAPPAASAACSFACFPPAAPHSRRVRGFVSFLWAFFFFFFFGGGGGGALLFVPLNFFFPPLCIRLLSSYGIYIKGSEREAAAGGREAGDGRAALFIGTQGWGCIMRAAFVLPARPGPPALAGLERRQPRRPQCCLPLLQGAPRRGHLVRGSRGEKKPPSAPLPPRLRLPQPLTKRDRDAKRRQAVGESPPRRRPSSEENAAPKEKP
ncbi:uncharacterized protein LOC129736039 [Falco cherrug]|uniref:uncharacterized protein LOC129736039 n=1 Tax=Falco cherrug TaxID=345164 RepID=UPI00247895A2|nr:uncharacterized protein LOC129736039 [Falco cherrug]